MKAAHPLRLRRVRFKDGRTIDVLRPKTENISAQLRGSVERAISTADSEIVGYALVAWMADGNVFPAYRNGQRSTIVSGQVPQYAKDCLLAEMACRWAKGD